MSTLGGLKAVALVEAGKGLLVLLVGMGAFLLFHNGAQTQADELVNHFHLNPAKQYPRIFLDLAESATPKKVKILAAGASAYAAIRFVEAYGLWTQRLWAEWFALVSASVYVPWEVLLLVRRATWKGALLLAVNLVIVAYLAWCVSQNRASSNRAKISDSV